MDTKRAIDEALLLISRNGWDGLECEASSLPLLLSHFGLDESPAVIRRVGAELRRQKLIETKRNKKRLHIQPTVKGMKRLQKAEVTHLQIPPHDSWDGVWRMVTYDVPRTQSAQRLIFTRQLRRLGFLPLRESVWFYPHPCFGTLTELSKYCGLQRFVTFAEVSRIDSVSLARLQREFPETA